MTLQAAQLLSRDFKLEAPLNGTPLPLPPGSPTPAQQQPTPTPMFPLMPVADVLITERRVCRACGSVSEAQSDRVHRLLSNCAGDPYKRFLRPRKPDELPLEMRVRHTITVEAEHCAICWTTTHFASQAFEVEPERPKRTGFTLTAIGIAMEAAKKEKLAKKDVRKTIASLPLDKALDLL